MSFIPSFFLCPIQITHEIVKLGNIGYETELLDLWHSLFPDWQNKNAYKLASLSRACDFHPPGGINVAACIDVRCYMHAHYGHLQVNLS